MLRFGANNFTPSLQWEKEVLLITDTKIKQASSNNIKADFEQES